MDDSLQFTETKNIDEKVTERELAVFLDIIDSLPDKQLPEFPTVFAPPPDWNKTRTLPIFELITEEQQKLAERWSVESIARHLQRKRVIQRVLRREQMTPEQFVSLALTIGVALSRNSVREDQDLKALLVQGEDEIKKLTKNESVFAELSRGDRYDILRRAIWVTRVERARRLAMVPPENISLVRKHLETLENIFPKEFSTNPFAAIADRLVEQGLPFEELAVSGRDDQIIWSRSEAKIGTDFPDSKETSQLR